MLRLYFVQNETIVKFENNVELFYLGSIENHQKIYSD